MSDLISRQAAINSLHMKIRLEADVPDTWEPGDCENCPFAYTEYFPAEWVAHCVIFDGMDMDCPASVVADS